MTVHDYTDQPIPPMDCNGKRFRWEGPGPGVSCLYWGRFKIATLHSHVHWQGRRHCYYGTDHILHLPVAVISRSLTGARQLVSRRMAKLIDQLWPGWRKR